MTKGRKMPDNISVEESPSQTSEKEDNEKQNSKRSNSYRCKEGKNVGVFFVLVVILITILVLYKAFLEKQAVTQIIREGALSPRQKQCSANSFMINDGVCDEITNVERCLFDGTDCCRRDSSKQMCNVCICKMLVDMDEFYNDKIPKFNARALHDPSDFETQDMTNWLEMPKSESFETCSMMCMDVELEALVNSWTYESMSKTCNCAWIEHISQDIATQHVEKVNSQFSIVQLDKMLLTEHLVLGVKYLAEAPLLATNASSAWTCKHKCLANPDCLQFSYQKTTGQLKNLTNCFLYGNNHTSKDWSCHGYPTWLIGSNNHNRLIDNKCLSQEKLLLVATGITDPSLPCHADSFSRDIEVIDIKNSTISCHYSKTNSSLITQGASGAVLASDGILICGGYRLLDFSSLPFTPPQCWGESNQCFELGDSAYDNPLSNLSVGEKVNSHYYTSGESLVHDTDTMFIVVDSSGFTNLFHWQANYSFNAKSEIAESGKGAPFLAKGSSRPCTCKFDNSNLLLIAEDQIWIYNTDTDNWNLMTTVSNYPDHFYCGCINVYDRHGYSMIVLTGGVDVIYRLNSDPVVYPTKTYVFPHDAYYQDLGWPSTSFWNDGPLFPTFLARASSVTLKDSLYVVGGHDAFDKMQTTIYRFSCQSEIDCSWNVMEQELTVGRADSVALIIPEYLGDCN